MTTLVHTMFLLVICFGIVGFILQNAFYFRLRHYHADVWQALGRPGLFSRAATGRSVIRFLWRREYQSLSDIRSVRLAQLFRVHLAFYTVLFVGLLVVFTWSLWIHR